jgi:hypothetical protein
LDRGLASRAYAPPRDEAIPRLTTQVQNGYPSAAVVPRPSAGPRAAGQPHPFGWMQKGRGTHLSGGIECRLYVVSLGIGLRRTASGMTMSIFGRAADDATSHCSATSMAGAHSIGTGTSDWLDEPSRKARASISACDRRPAD